MNYFFGLSNNWLKSNIQIPKFNNKNNFKNKSNQLFKINIKNNKWNLENINSVKQDENFYYLNEDLSNNWNIFFLASKNDCKNFNNSKLIKLNNFTETFPPFRCNLEIFNSKGGFSSYQSEYPQLMMSKSGIVVSPIFNLLDNKNQKNFIFFKNIIDQPKNLKFEGYLVNVKKKKIEKKIELLTNFSNFFEVDNSLIHPEIYFVTNKYLGIPLFISINNNHISFEHTHPQLEYIQSPDRFLKIKQFKNEIYEIIS